MECIKNTFKECFELAKCRQCLKVNKFSYFVPHGCEHRLCVDCYASRPPVCPTCNSPWKVDDMIPDIAFALVFNCAIEELDTQTLDRLVEECGSKEHSPKNIIYENTDTESEDCLGFSTPEEQTFDESAKPRSSTKGPDKYVDADHEPPGSTPTKSHAFEKATAPYSSSRNADETRPSESQTPGSTHKKGYASKKTANPKLISRVPDGGSETPCSSSKKRVSGCKRNRMLSSSDGSESPRPHENSRRPLEPIGSVLNSGPSASSFSGTTPARNDTLSATPKPSKNPRPSTSLRATPICRRISSATPKSSKKSTPWSRNPLGETFLHEYCSMGFKGHRGFSLQVLKDILAEGANPNSRDNSGITPLHESVHHGNLEIMKVLLDGGALVNGYREPPSTPLHDAVTKFVEQKIPVITNDSIAFKILSTLLDYGSDKSLKDNFRRTPIDIAENSPPVLDILTGYKPKVTQRRQLLGLQPQMEVIFSTKAYMDEFQNNFNVRCLPGPGFKSTATHLVVPDGTQNANHLMRMAILSGCYVVTIKWVTDSLEEKKLLPEEPYEIRGPLVVNSKETYVTRKARMDRLLMRPKLFASGQFHVMPRGIPEKTRSETLELIKAGGGTVLTREPKPGDFGVDEPKLFHARDGSRFERCSVFILYAREPRPLFDMDHIKHVPLTWFMDCVDTYSIREE